MLKDEQSTLALQVADFEEAAALVAHCVRQPYPDQTVPPFSISGSFTAFATPDSTWVVLKRHLDGAVNSIVIGMYDFSAPYVAEALLAALERGVKVSMMLDLNPSDAQANDIFTRLKEAGAHCVLAPSCRGKAAAHFFPVAHEKVILVDGRTTFVQSGNFSAASTPNNEGDGVLTPEFKTGNRDMGVVVESEPLANFFADILAADMQRETDAEEHPLQGFAVAELQLTDTSVLGIVAPQPPPKLFPSHVFTPDGPVRVQPVLTPDNYMAVVPPVIRAAKKSILIEQQYIRAYEVHVAALCEAILDAKNSNPTLDVRVIVAPPFTNTAKDRALVAKDLNVLANDYSLASGDNVRMLSHKYFAHLHNKLIIVDGERVLISSQNWSSPAVADNREAGLLIDYPDLAAYYSDIFEEDWKTAVQSLPDVQALRFLSILPPETSAFHEAATQSFIKLSPGDVTDV